MFKVIATIVACIAALLLSASTASADTQTDIAATCARATIPTALCNGSGGTTNNTTIDNVKYVEKARLYMGNNPDTGNPIFVKPEQAQPGQRDSDGNLVRDLSGYQYK